MIVNLTVLMNSSKTSWSTFCYNMGYTLLERAYQITKLQNTRIKIYGCRQCDCKYIFKKIIRLKMIIYSNRVLLCLKVTRFTNQTQRESWTGIGKLYSIIDACMALLNHSSQIFFLPILHEYKHAINWNTVCVNSVMQPHSVSHYMWIRYRLRSLMGLMT